MLSDHEFFLTCDPLLQKYELITTAELLTTLNPPPSIPDHVRSQLRRSFNNGTEEAGKGLGKEQGGEGNGNGNGKGNGEEEGVMPTCYRVTDIVHAIPAGIWDTNVVSTYEFTDIRDGLFVRIRGPLAVVMDTFWEVREVGDGDGDDEEMGLELVEEVTIRCSRLLMGIVRGQCENGREKIHAKMIARLEGELK
jgi:hypothetical protein